MISTAVDADAAQIDTLVAKAIDDASAEGQAPPPKPSSAASSSGSSGALGPEAAPPAADVVDDFIVDSSGFVRHKMYSEKVIGRVQVFRKNISGVVRSTASAGFLDPPTVSARSK